MCKLIYGRDSQVEFLDEKEKNEAIDYLLNPTPNVVFVKEKNEEQGAWASEYRIHFKSTDGVPAGLMRNMTAGNSGLAGRINCKELIDELRERGLPSEYFE